MKPRLTNLNTLNLGDQIRVIADRLNRSLAETHRAVATKLFSAIIMDTPVDTGEAAGGWTPSMGSPIVGATGVTGPTAQAQAVSAVQATIRALPSQVAWLTNSVPHVPLLEYGTASYGYSPKAPSGMVRINIIRFQRLVEEEFGRARSNV